MSSRGRRVPQFSIKPKRPPIGSYLLINKLLKDPPALTVITRPLTHGPRGLENLLALRMLDCTRLKRGCSVRPRIVGSQPRWQTAIVLLRSPSLELLLGLTSHLGGITRKPDFSTHAAPICRLLVCDGPLRRMARDRLPNLEVKVGNGFSIGLRLGIVVTLPICPVDYTCASFIMRATTMDVERRWHLGL